MQVIGIGTTNMRPWKGRMPRITCSDARMILFMLQPIATATSVRLRQGKRMVTDGPFAETREQLGGYFLVDANDLDEAIGMASKIPGAAKGTVEIRPVMEISGLPDGAKLAETNTH
jgi:hypothetical protein